MSLGLHVSPLCGAIPVESGTTPAELVPLLWNWSHSCGLLPHSCGLLSHSCGLHRSPVSPTGMGGALKSTALSPFGYTKPTFCRYFLISIMYLCILHSNKYRCKGRNKFIHVRYRRSWFSSPFLVLHWILSNSLNVWTSAALSYPCYGNSYMYITRTEPKARPMTHGGFQNIWDPSIEIIR